jgi:hypothetical protein
MFSVVSASPASAAPQVATASAIYDSVDAVEVRDIFIIVTGVIAGQSHPSELQYRIYTSNDPSSPSRCDRIALLALAKPGKYQFATVFDGTRYFSCKLIVRTP